MACTTFIQRRFMSKIRYKINLALLGAAGRIGQPLALLYKSSNYLNKLSLYDINPVHGIAKDLSHIDTPSEVKPFEKDQLGHCLVGADVVTIVAGSAPKPGMTSEELFFTNACVIKQLAEECANYCPKAFVMIVTNPVNTLVPLFSDVYKKYKVYDPKKIFGITKLNVVRAKTFIAEMTGTSSQDVKIDVIGGHTPSTIIPVLSRSVPSLECFPTSDIMNLAKKIQEGDADILKAKENNGYATLSAAHAVAEFTFSLCRAINNEQVLENAYVASSMTDSPYFALPVLLGPQGIVKIYGLGILSDYERKLTSKIDEKLRNELFETSLYTRGIKQ